MIYFESLLPTTTTLGTSSFTINENGDIKTNNALATLATSTGATVINYLESDKYDEAFNRYASIKEGQSYVESLSDEELVNALEKLDLLETEMSTEPNSKRI